LHLPPEHCGDLGLGESRQLGGLDPSKAAALDDLRDLGNELGLDQHLAGVRATEKCILWIASDGTP